MFVWNSGDLNQEQEDAVNEPGNVFLMACPGSGKTRALSYKIALELSKLQGRNKYVIAITYTNKAADEISERITLLGVETDNLWIGTIHSFCLEWILRPYYIYEEGLKFGFRVIDSYESEIIFSKLCNPYKKNRVSHWDCGYYFTHEGYVLTCSDIQKHKIINKVMGEYFSILNADHKIDYELLLYYSLRILNSNPSISNTLGKIFSQILVDEYQDTKEVQYHILAKIISASNQSIKSFFVGDPDQAIFQSLGGFPIDPNEFMRLSGTKMKKMGLTENYRSSLSIINYFSNYKISNGAIGASSIDKSYPSTISYTTNTSKDDLADRIVELINLSVDKQNTPLNEIAVIGPQWVHLAVLTRKLMEKLPHHSFDGPGMVPFSRDLDNFWYKLSKVVLTEPSPSMYIKRLRWAQEVINDLKNSGLNVDLLSSRIFLRISNTIVIEENDGLEYLQLYFDKLFSDLGLDYKSVSSLDDQLESFILSSKSRIRRLIKEGSQSIGTTENFKKVFKPRKGVTVSTIHGAKGLEYDVVIAFGLLEGMVPHFADANGHESAMRLLYVVGSRARKNLHLISETGRRYNPHPSNVLNNLKYPYSKI